MPVEPSIVASRSGGTQVLVLRAILKACAYEGRAILAQVFAVVLFSGVSSGFSISISSVAFHLRPNGGMGVDEGTEEKGMGAKF